jgi:hypothetical protein
MLAWTTELADLQVNSRKGEPSGGLEPPTPSLPFWGRGNWSQPVATVLACFGRFPGPRTCHRLPLVATARLHRRSILRCLL